MAGSVFGGLPDCCHKPIAPAGNCFYELHSARRFAQSLSEQGNVLGQIAFLDEGVRPYPLHQIVFFDYVTTLLHERE